MDSLSAGRLQELLLLGLSRPNLTAQGCTRPTAAAAEANEAKEAEAAAALQPQTAAAALMFVWSAASCECTWNECALVHL